MKFILSILLIASTMAMTSCHRNKYYTCQCSTTDTSIAYDIGQTTKDNAYAICRTHQDSVTTCNMIIF